ncbi:hypothetical protein [Zunongwangia endophytica]|uniref:Uncharacterized protein n=1 Tax=Zunongwangia endophytica TaxID=1808945 RepID=A0ABV8H9Y7_9FLAO|nr:hypothetical protein [Zunongwangia endophytica]MDN3593712.1 hypothetical protein [Zunongwangia endophytica]
MKKISGRDIKFALAGFLCYFALNVVLDFKENKTAFVEGYSSGKDYFMDHKK